MPFDIRNFASFSKRNSFRKLIASFFLLYTLHNFYSHDQNSKYSRLLFLFTKDLSRYRFVHHCNHHPYAYHSIPLPNHCPGIYFLLVQSDFLCLYDFSKNNLRKDELHTATKLFPQHCHNWFNFIPACVVRMLTSSSSTRYLYYIFRNV